MSGLGVRVRVRVSRPAAQPEVPVSGLGRRPSVSGRPLEGWPVASKRLRPLPRARGSALAHACGWQGWPCGAAAGEGGRRVDRLEDKGDTGEI